MANPHKGEIVIKLPNSIKKGYIKPAHGIVTLKLDYNTMADAELEFRGSDSMLHILAVAATDPTRVSFHDMRVILAAALKHQFGGINSRIAGQILGVEDFGYVVDKIGDAIKLAFRGTIVSEEDMGEETTEGVEEGVEETAIKN